MSDATQNPEGDAPPTEQEVRTEIRSNIEKLITENEVILFMKGTPDEPACGFSARAAGVLNALEVRYGAVNIFAHPFIRDELSGLSGWPTIPQLFVKGELVGGSDIMLEMFESGELAEKLGVEQPAEHPPVGEGPPRATVPLEDNLE
jgi:monothiol glutaredoxin